MQRPRSADWSRRFFVAIVAVAGACASRLNPVVQVPVLPVHLELEGLVRSDSGTPIFADLTLVRLTRKGRADTIGKAAVPPGHRFRFDSLAPGAYVLNTRSLGFRRRSDTLSLGAPPGLEVVLALQSANMCMDLCPPDPRLVEAAHAQQHRWQCDREHTSIDLVRARWAALLADSAMQTYFRHGFTSLQIASQLQRVRSDTVCRRLAITLFPAGTSLAYTVFRWPPYWLLSDPGFDEAVVANDSLRPLAGSSGGGFLVWATDRRDGDGSIRPTLSRH